MYNDEFNDDFELDENDLKEDYGVDKILSELPKKRKRRKSTDEYYVKGADLIEEIKKYQISKKEDAETRGVPLSER